MKKDNKNKNKFMSEKLTKAYIQETYESYSTSPFIISLLNYNGVSYHNDIDIYLVFNVCVYISEIPKQYGLFPQKNTNRTTL